MKDVNSVVKNYKGKNTFIIKMKTSVIKYGSLTPKQIEVVEKILKQEEESAKTHKLNIPLNGDTIKIGRFSAIKLKENYNLKFNPLILDVVRVTGVSEKAVKLIVKLTTKKFKVCNCCARTLTDDFSMLTGTGKICATKVGVEYIKNQSDVDRFNNDFLTRVNEIGEMELWVPKTQIKKWDGKMSKFLEISKFWVQK